MTKHLPPKPANLKPSPTTGGSTVSTNVTPKQPKQGGGAPGTSAPKK